MGKSLDVVIEKCTVKAIILEKKEEVTLVIDVENKPAQKYWIGKKVGDTHKLDAANITYKIIKIEEGLPEAEKKEEPIVTKTTEKAKQSKGIKKSEYAPKLVINYPRVEGGRKVFWVFQGTSFSAGSRGGYIWAPIYDQSGNEPHHWKRLLDVREGDIILHGCDGMLKAISVAQGPCFDCIQPKELEDEKLWGASGRMVKCEYEIIDNPIKTSNYKAEIISLPTPLYAPFDRNGNGNMGYLYEIDPELVKIFVSETIKKNPKLAAVAHIVSLI